MRVSSALIVGAVSDMLADAVAQRSTRLQRHRRGRLHRICMPLMVTPEVSILTELAPTESVIDWAAVTALLPVETR